MNIMDDQKRQYLSEQQTPQPAPEQPPEPAPAQKTHNLVLQPSAELVQQVETEQAVKAAAQTAPTQAQDTPQAVIVSSPDQTQRPVAPQSIYPEATRDIRYAASSGPSTSPSAAAAETEVAELARYNAGKVRTVHIVAGILILLNLIYLGNWMLLGLFNFISIIPFAIVGFYLFLLVGIYRLKETARLIYVVLATVSLFFTAIGLMQSFLFNAATPQRAVNTTSITQQEKASDERTIANYKNIEHPTPGQKIAEDNAENSLRSINARTSSASAVALKAKRYTSETLGIVLAIGPLIIFTRPSIKGLFS